MGIINSAPFILSSITSPMTSQMTSPIVTPTTSPTTSPISKNESEIKKLRIRIPNHPTCNECGKFSSITELEERGQYINWYPVYCSYVNDSKCFGELVIN